MSSVVTMKTISALVVGPLASAAVYVFEAHVINRPNAMIFVRAHVIATSFFMTTSSPVQSLSSPSAWAAACKHVLTPGHSITADMATAPTINTGGDLRLVVLNMASAVPPVFMHSPSTLTPARVTVCEVRRSGICSRVDVCVPVFFIPSLILKHSLPPGSPNAYTYARYQRTQQSKHAHQHNA